MWDVNTPASRIKGWNDVGFQRVADHQAFQRPVAMALEETFVGACILVADDLDGVEIIAKAGGSELAFLVEEIAFRDHDKAEGAV
ncbi:hypothetical protein D9M70_645740 [compost metagenome]